MKIVYFKPRFAPEKDLWVILLSWIFIVGSLLLATFVATPSRGGLYFILYAVLGATIFGVAFPVYWTLFRNKEKLVTLGFTTKNLVLSLVIQIVVFFLLYYTKFSILTQKPIDKMIPLISLALSIGFFEAIFWRGWMISKLEKSFGTIPSVLISSILYSLYHIGYGMKLNEMIFLFFIGLMFAVFFAITRNLFVLIPLFQPFGQLITLVKDNLQLPLIASVGFLEVLIGMIVILIILNNIAMKKAKIM
jgi:hypothetical protein